MENSMKYFITKISSLLILLLPALLGSCSNGREEEPASSIYPEGEGNMVLNIAPLTRADDDLEKEKLNSLRIVLLDSEGRLKANERITISDMNLIPYTWNFNTAFGRYSIYVIANEDKIYKYTIEGEEPTKEYENITDRINNFTLGQSGFAEFINSIYFSPSYNTGTNYTPIPKSAMYEFDFTQANQNLNVWLVPVAVKFEVIMKNYRNNEVTIKSIKLNKSGKNNYLMARLDDNELHRSGLYWIDWLKEVAKDTQDNSGNDYINDKWGWITGYYLPTDDHFQDYIVNTPLRIDPGNIVDDKDPEPAIIEFGPFYYPESKYIDKDTGQQSYSLEFEIATTGEAKTIEKVLPHVKSLFRNTQVKITIELNNANEEIYAEVSMWKELDPVYGTIYPQ